MAMPKYRAFISLFVKLLLQHDIVSRQLDKIGAYIGASLSTSCEINMAHFAIDFR